MSKKRTSFDANRQPRSTRASTSSFHRPAYARRCAGGAQRAPGSRAGRHEASHHAACCAGAKRQSAIAEAPRGGVAARLPAVASPCREVLQAATPAALLR